MVSFNIEDLGILANNQNSLQDSCSIVLQKMKDVSMPYSWSGLEGSSYAEVSHGIKITAFLLRLLLFSAQLAHCERMLSGHLITPALPIGSPAWAVLCAPTAKQEQRAGWGRVLGNVLVASALVLAVPSLLSSTMATGERCWMAIRPMDQRRWWTENISAGANASF